MLAKTIETLKYLLLEYSFYFLSIKLLLALLIYSYNETLNKRLIEINKELYKQQVTFERRQKAHNGKMKQQHAKIEGMIKEINLHK